jgi:hypothetical protein
MYHVEGNLEKARKTLETGRKDLKDSGESMSPDMATCLYKLGVIELREYYAGKHKEKLEKAGYVPLVQTAPFIFHPSPAFNNLDNKLTIKREYFRESLTLMDLCQVADCEIARASYMLSVVLSLGDLNESDGRRLRSKAEAVRRAMQKDKYIAEAHGEWSYDRLVESWVR